MASDRRRTCQRCKGHERDVGAISWRGKCEVCSQAELYDTIHQMHSRSGPKWDKWRRNMAACVGGVLLDDARDAP